MARNTTSSLIELARAGDRDAFDRLASQHIVSLRAFVRACLGRGMRARIEADDVVQEVFLRAMRSIDRFQDEGAGSFLRWLNRIADNVILEATRRGRKEIAVPFEPEPILSCTTPSRTMRREERLERLESAMDGLKPEYREVIRLARIEKLPVKEIARRMGRSPNATSMLLMRALELLRRRFGETESLHLPARPLRGHSPGRVDGKRT